jgi:gluconolactonase
MEVSLTLYHEKAFQFLRKDLVLQTLAGDCSFTEGPVWNKKGFYLFSDITANCIYSITPGNRKEIFLADSGTADPQDADLKSEQAGSNGLAYNQEGELLVCRHGSHQVAMVQQEKLTAFISEYNSRPFNSPNDIVCHQDGSIYFSDPPYGLKDGKLNPFKFQPVAGVYCYREGKISLICDRYQYPNGVCFSPDGSRIYICSNKPFEKFISEYDVQSNQFIREFAKENADGVKCDIHGNFYLCTNEGLVVLDSEGHRMVKIELPAIPANACFGGTTGKDLFITARENIYLLTDALL